MFEEAKKWIDSVLPDELPEGVRGVAFNIYEDGDNMWSFEIVGASRFDSLDDEWACDEITDFGTRDEPFSWEDDSEWEDILDEMKELVSDYLEFGECKDVLKTADGVAVGFVDGDLTTLYIKE